MIDIKTRPWKSKQEEKPVLGKVVFIVKGVKISQLIDPAVLAASGIVPADGPAGNPTIELRIEDSPITVSATMNGKSVRKAIKAINEHTPAGCNVIIQGIAKPSPDGKWLTLECAGLTVTPKGRPAEKPAEEAVS